MNVKLLKKTLFKVDSNIHKPVATEKLFMSMHFEYDRCSKA